MRWVNHNFLLTFPQTDIIAFQETTENADKFIRLHPYIREHYFITPLTGQGSQYKVSIASRTALICQICFLSKYQPKQIIRHDIPFKRAPRKAIQADFEFNGKLISFVSVHLESDSCHDDVWRFSSLELIGSLGQSGSISLY